MGVATLDRSFSTGPNSLKGPLMPSAKEAASTIGLVMAGVIAAAVLVRWGVKNNIPVLKLAAI